MRQDRTQDRVAEYWQHRRVGPENSVIEPFAHSFNQVVAVLGRSSPITRDHYRVSAKLARYDFFLEVEAVENGTIEFLNAVGRQDLPLAVENVLRYLVRGCQHIVDFLGEVLLRRWKLQFAL